MKQKLVKNLIMGMIAMSSCFVAQSFVGSNQTLAMNLENFIYKFGYGLNENLKRTADNAENIGFMYRYEFWKLCSSLEASFEKLKKRYSGLIDDDVNRIKEFSTVDSLKINGDIPVKIKPSCDPNNFNCNPDFEPDPGFYYYYFTKSHNNEDGFKDYDTFLRVSNFGMFLKDVGVYDYYGTNDIYSINDKDPKFKLLSNEEKFDDYQRNFNSYEGYMLRMMDYRFNILRIFSDITGRNLLDTGLKVGRITFEKEILKYELEHVLYRDKETAKNVEASLTELYKIYQFVEKELVAGGFLRSV